MDTPADFEIARRSGAPAQVVLTGDWTATGLGRAGERVSQALRPSGGVAFDLSRLGRFDTAGALALLNAVEATSPGEVQVEGLDARTDVRSLLQFVRSARIDQAPPRARGGGLYGLFVRVGRGVAHLVSELFHTLAFYGRLVAALWRVMLNPRRIRVAPCVSLMERAGLDALPIIATTNFFVGATIAFLGQSLLNQFGAKIFSVELVGIGVLREFGVLVTAIILAGRSASSFAAEIGAMKMNQEVDAMQTMGVDPFEALVLPRFIALLTMTPLLTFMAMLAGLFGGLITIWTAVGLSPAFFLQRLVDNVGINQFYIGMVKAPFLAVIIAAIGCRQGLEVGGDVEQLGRRVTTAVVQALFSIIIVDAIFSLIFMEFGL
ncbi:MAG: MlaE family lipid ABC transporter permease subunit [Caulobacteraceae bacterium]